MSRYEEKKQAKIERFSQYAENAERRSVQAFKQADSIASFIPMGQPILVGHHSERRHRRDIEKIHNGMNRGVEEEKKAKYWAQRAANVSDPNRIDSDDPEAMDKLEDKIAAMERMGAEMKRINAEYRKNGGKLSEIQMSDRLRKSAESILRVQGYYNAPFPPYALSNLRQRIATAKKRTEALERAESFPSFTVNEIGVTLLEGQIQVSFPFKPDEETRTKLKSWPLSLKWSRFSTAWVRKYTGQGEHFINELKKVLEVAKS